MANNIELRSWIIEFSPSKERERAEVNQQINSSILRNTLMVSLFRGAQFGTVLRYQDKLRESNAREKHIKAFEPYNITKW